MSRALRDRSGERLGRLTVLARAESRGKSTYWLCRCDCGVEKEMAASALKGSVSCGCYRREMASIAMRRMSLSHGKSRTRLYRVWQSFRDRCNNPNAQAYENYGGRGITVCESWDDFLVFEAWALSSGYKKGLSLDRIDNDKGYSPGNCRWATMRQQSNNRRSSMLIAYNGESLSATEWSRKLGIKKATIFSRIRAGLPVEEVLSPVLKGNYRHDSFKGYSGKRSKPKKEAIKEKKRC